MPVAIKVGYPYHVPASRKSRPIQAGAEKVVVKIPYRRPSRASIVKQVIRMAVPIKVSHSHHAPGRLLRYTQVINVFFTVERCGIRDIATGIV